MTFLYRHLEEGSFKTAYADTDRESFHFYLTILLRILIKL